MVSKPRTDYQVRYTAEKMDFAVGAGDISAAVGKSVRHDCTLQFAPRCNHSQVKSVSPEHPDSGHADSSLRHHHVSGIGRQR